MFRFDADLKVYVHRDAIDFRKGFTGLSTIVEQALGLDPSARAVYVFRNRRADRLKLLLWERNGFWLMLRRLEADCFAWPRSEPVLELSVEQLHWLLEGINLTAMRKHPARYYARVS
ncbi:IS66 family insertion sequence element accessory protein TnpB [Paraburkholderia sp. MM5384-R2]|uniref:IS66 family insertion sequence element accessory protein TnpB n=1 Tax=Paraburkholderia sp. MM5384-R2 TaxID=2723097 RepID=UPI0016119E43|nr:IS66 family insertion sequence element accessory protein TnpB [Paraburkholderia sp. MM5384-R2]MBB5503725.1 transposase [Paraburkholderia sp. MM5384-R2]